MELVKRYGSMNSLTSAESLSPEIAPALTYLITWRSEQAQP
uniref:Uncharacterized protein n=1 Tax=Brassica oleracea TaxID=3712 RepID=A0A3P6GVX2_BRAOL|nr:unnamed protein product [Brassica oleracea]